jgi:hypothetical protein
MRTPIDRYNKSVKGDEALKFEPPPAPAAPTNDPNLMRLYVPSENTELDFGAGKTPGIRMATDNHAHLTARAPRTTISLGAPGGDGIGDPAAGLQLYTEGEKRETIDGPAVEWYKATKMEHVYVGLVEDYACPKDEKVQGRWTETCTDSKQESIHGPWLQQCDDAKTETITGTHNLTVGKLATHEFGAGRVERVTGDARIDTSGTKHEKIGADWIVDVEGKRHFSVKGDLTYNVKGVSGSTVDGVTWTVHKGATVSNFAIKSDVALLKFDNVAVRQQKIGAELSAVASYIKSSIMTIFK